MWQPTEDIANSPAYIVDALNLARATGLAPSLMKTPTGDRALVLLCRAALPVLAVQRPAGAKDNTGEKTTPKCEEGLLAILALAQQSDARRTVEALEQATASQGHMLELVGLPTSDLTAVQLEGLGLQPVSDVTVGRPGAEVYLYRLPSPNAPLRDHLAAGRPPLTGEPPDNLKRRGDWFQRRSGGRD